MTEKLIRKTVNFDIKDIDETESSFWAVASDEGIDRDGDIISADAWDLKSFKKNPVVPLFHQYHVFPVAKASKIKVSEGKLMFKPIFAVNENPEAKIAFDLYKGGFMSAFSVGFMPAVDGWTDEERKDGRTGRNYTKVELLEISAVLVPSNPNALIEARSKGINVDMIDTIGDKDKTDKQEDKSEETETFINEIKTEIQNIKTEIEEFKKEVAVQIADLLIKYSKIADQLTLTPKDLGLANVILDLQKLIRKQ